MTTVQDQAPAPDRYLLELATVLWPGGQQRAMLVLPSRARPRMLVPAGPPAAAAASVRALSSGRSPREVFRREAVCLSLRLGLGPVLGRGRRLSVGGTWIDAELSAVLGEPVTVAVAVGPPRANRKPVLTLVREDGSHAGFAKLGTGALTDRLVTDEGTALEALAQHERAVLVVPRLLHRGHIAGHPVVVQSALVTRRSRVPSAAKRRAAEREIAALGQRSTTLRETRQWATLHDRLGRIQDDPRSGQLARAAERLDRRAGSSWVLAGAWHGDWTPWNLAARGERVQAWDWERLARDVPRGFDSLHYSLHDRLRRRRSGGPREAAAWLLASAPGLLAPLGVPAQWAPATATAYLLELGVRHLEDRQDIAGATVGPIDHWLLPALEA